MKYVFIVVFAGVVAAIRLRQRRRRRGEPRTARPIASSISSDVGLIVSREVRERFRGRIFRYGTLFILIVVAAAIIIPTLNTHKTKPQNIGVVGSLSPSLVATVSSTATSVGATVHFVAEVDLTHARTDLRSGRINVAIVDARTLIVNKPLSATDTSVGAQLLRSVAQNLGIDEAFQAARLSPAQSETLRAAKALPITSVEPATTTTVHATSVIGAILIFIMLSQYNGWILMGVMEEKASRVIEVLLSAVRPIQLLTGKVIGIGLAALTQALVVVAFAIGVSKAVGSSFLSGTAPLVIMSTLVWLVLGYSFYCWLYAAAGSMVERQDQVQGLVLPLSLPMIFGYIMALTAASSGSPSLLLKVLAYLPPTAPFAMPVLVGFSAVTWWEFLTSVFISVVCTIGVARLASTIYRRAILRTGGRVRLREVFARTGAH
ncbi:MAG: ABC transporter permease [Acidobacteria bacterium]|nr:ABC transporter permease [Acidobacteriota bacterium]